MNAKEMFHCLILLVTIKLCFGLEKFMPQITKGVVMGENYIYYSLTFKGNIILELHSRAGDADLYVLENNKKPTYANYDLHSATCGVDVVQVPGTFARPIGVGVYGHPSHDNSTYTLEIYRDSSQPDEEDEEERQRSAEDNNVRKKVKTILGRSGLWALLEVFEMMFL